MDEKFEQFIETVDEGNRSFVRELDKYLIENNCKCEIKSAKSGPVVSYIVQDTKRTLATFVFRKAGVKLRMYPEHIAKYQDFLDTLPAKMKKEIQKSSVCKRLINPEDCNPRCVQGFTFVMGGGFYQKCRYMAFMPALNEENNPFIKQFLENEIES